MHGPTKTVHLAEEKVVPMQCDNGVWVLDTGASNHMTGTREPLNHLDDEVSAQSASVMAPMSRSRGLAQSSWKDEINIISY